MRRMIPDNEWKKQVEDLQALLGGYTSDDASTKKIYCHPIYCSLLRTSDNEIVCFTCLIFNDDNTPFTKETFFNWCDNLFTNYPDASVMASGFKADKYIASRLKKGNMADSFIMETSNTSNASENWSVYKSDLLKEATIFNDGVNPIN